MTCEPQRGGLVTSIRWGKHRLRSREGLLSDIQCEDKSVMSSRVRVVVSVTEPEAFAQGEAESSGMILRAGLGLGNTPRETWARCLLPGPPAVLSGKYVPG